MLGVSPDDEVVVLVIDERRNASVGVELRVLRVSLFAFVQVEENSVIFEAELLKHHGDLPAILKGEFSSIRRGVQCNVPAVSAGVGLVKGEVRHEGVRLMA